MIDSVSKSKPKTSTERGRARDKRLEKFGIKKRYYRTSATQRRLVSKLMTLRGSSHEELIHDALMLMAQEHGLTLQQMKRELDCQQQEQK